MSPRCAPHPQPPGDVASVRRRDRPRQRSVSVEEAFETFYAGSTGTHGLANRPFGYAVAQSVASRQGGDQLADRVVVGSGGAGGGTPSTAATTAAAVGAVHRSRKRAPATYLCTRANARVMD